MEVTLPVILRYLSLSTISCSESCKYEAEKTYPACGESLFGECIFCNFAVFSENTPICVLINSAATVHIPEI